MNWPENWDKLESEHNRDYDPYVDICQNCRAHDSFEDDEDEAGKFYFCKECGERSEIQ